MEEGILQLLELSGGSETDSIIHLEPDEKLIEEGETDDRVYILLDGSLNVSHIIDGEESLLAIWTCVESACSTSTLLPRWRPRDTTLRCLDSRSG